MTPPNTNQTGFRDDAGDADVEDERKN
ncbi:uncharacterized protein METZ01_LOCUS294159 [marine metagenome]|uniref:Uncharacterized protein n=1 Tax=marine metagenome TaxID=408172 RepID=A0A382M055_9ZZZZ